MNLLLDANVLIDYLGRKAPFYASAQRVVAAGFFGDAKLWVPAQSATDAFYVLNRYVDSEKLQKALLRAFEVVEPVSLTGDDVRQAARLSWSDYEDCLVSVAASKVRADYIITRDDKGFSRSGITAISPDSWLAMMRADHGLVYDEIVLT